MAASHQRQLLLVVEGTAALGQYWNVIRSEYIDRIVKSFHGYDNLGQKSSGSLGEMALVVFYSHGSHNGCLLQQTGWTTNLELFWRWLSCIYFSGGGFGEAAIAEGLAEALLMCCPNPVVSPVSQAVERQKHCVLVAASNPHRLPTPIPRPPVNTLVQPSTTGDPIAEHWWLADADTVSKAFSQCLVSLSVISPRQLPSLKSIYNGAKRSGRVTDPPLDAPKYPHHMVLLSEGFVEARVALSRTVASSNGLAVPKIEPTSITPTSIAAQVPTVNARATTSTSGIVAGRQGAPNGVIPAPTVKMEVSSVPAMVSASGLSHVPSALTVQNPMPVSLSVPHPSVSTLPNQEPLQSNLISDGTVAQDFKPLVNNTAPSLRAIGVNSGNANLLSSSAQVRPIMSTTTPGVNNLGIPAATGSGVGLPMPSMLSSSTGAGVVSTSQNLHGVAQSGLGITNNPVGLGVGLGMGQGVGLGGFGNSGNLVGNANLGPLPAGANANNTVANVQVVGLGQSGLGQGGLTGSNQIGQNGLVMGHNVLPSLGPVGVNSGGGTMIPTPGLSQPVQGLQSLPVVNKSVQNPLQQVPTTVATPPQQQIASNYARLWQGILTGQRHGKSVFICKLEGYTRFSPPDKLSADWPPTMQIFRLIAQDHMNNKDYQGKSELLLFRTMGQHGFLVQLAEKKLCAVILLPSQTLLLASTDKPERMIGMLFPGDMVVFKPQPSSQQQQAQSAASGIGQAFSQGQLAGQGRPQMLQAGQLSGQGPASLSGTGFLP